MRGRLVDLVMFIRMMAVILDYGVWEIAYWEFSVELINRDSWWSLGFPGRARSASVCVRHHETLTADIQGVKSDGPYWYEGDRRSLLA